MAWHAYTVSWQLESGLHVGNAGFGNVRETRLYVPGRTLLGAMVARLIADHRLQGADATRLFQEACRLFRWSYGFFALDDKPLMPMWKDGTLWYLQRTLSGGAASHASFLAQDVEQALLASHASTTLDLQRTALDASLHEVEFVSPRLRGPLQPSAKKGSPTGETAEGSTAGDTDSSSGLSITWQVGTPVLLHACVAVHEDATVHELLSGWQDALARVVLGGERRYGYGRVRLVSLKAQETDWWLGYRCRWSDEGPIIELASEAPLPGHAQVGDADNPDQVDGELEVLVWRTTTDRARYGATLVAGGPAWTPGTRFAGDASPRRYLLGENGVYVQVTR